LTLQERLQWFEQTNKNLIDETTSARTRVEQLEASLAVLTTENEQIQLAYQRKFDVDINTNTYRHEK
jgi:hypothetical protein